MRRLIAAFLCLITMPVVMADSYTYTVNVLNKMNTDLIVSDAASSPIISATTIAPNQKQTFQVTDDGKSMLMSALGKSVCRVDDFNMLDFTFFLQGPSPTISFDVTVEGGVVPGGYQLQCYAMASGMGSKR